MVAFEDEYRAYGEAIASAIRGSRQRVEVAVAELGTLGAEVVRLDPDLVICSRPNTVDPGGRPAWVELSADPDQPSRICVGGRRSESRNPSFEELLSAIDELEGLIETNRVPGGC